MQGPSPLKQPADPRSCCVGHCWLWVGPVPQLQEPAVLPEAALLPTSPRLTPQLLVLYMFFSEHPAKSGAEQEDNFFYKQGRAPSPAAPGSQQLCALPAPGLLPQQDPTPEPAPSRQWVLPLLQDRGRDLHWPSSKKRVLHQDRRSGDQRRRTKGRIECLESPWQLLGVLRRKQRVCECRHQGETLEAYDNVKICMNLNKIKIFTLSNKTTSEIPDCIMKAERSRAGTGEIQSTFSRGEEENCASL